MLHSSGSPGLCLKGSLVNARRGTVADVGHRRRPDTRCGFTRTHRRFSDEPAKKRGCMQAIAGGSELPTVAYRELRAPS